MAERKKCPKCENGKVVIAISKSTFEELKGKCLFCNGRGWTIIKDTNNGKIPKA